MPSKANDHYSYILKRIYYENKSGPDLRKIVSTVIGTCEFNFTFEILSFNKTFIQLDLARVFSTPYLTRHCPTFFLNHMLYQNETLHENSLILTS